MSIFLASIMIGFASVADTTTATWLGFFGASSFSATSLTLAYRPFLDPVAAHQWWYLFLFPLVIGISVSYKAMRLPSLDRIWWQVGKMSVQIIGAILLMSVLLVVLVQWVIPHA